MLSEGLWHDDKGSSFSFHMAFHPSSTQLLGSRPFQCSPFACGCANQLVINSRNRKPVMKHDLVTSYLLKYAESSIVLFCWWLSNGFLASFWLLSPQNHGAISLGWVSELDPPVLWGLAEGWTPVLWQGWYEPCTFSIICLLGIWPPLRAVSQNQAVERGV
jgi:hypothetical protein